MWRVKTVTKFKNYFFPDLIYWNDIEIHLGFQHSYLVPPPIDISAKQTPHHFRVVSHNHYMGGWVSDTHSVCHLGVDRQQLD